MNFTVRKSGLNSTVFEAGSPLMFRSSLLARWKKYVTRGGSKSWDQWKPAYINVLQNRRIGPAWEQFLFENWGLAGLPAEAGWQMNRQMPKNIMPRGPVFDIFNVADSVPVSKWLLIEAKSGTELGTHARKQFVDHVKRMGRLGGSLMMMFAGRPADAHAAMTVLRGHADLVAGVEQGS